ncbi:RNase H domain-containing protein [Trichonephila clavipes]|nr:RNase H domain-containing protein [Trichonephila clavipes]
MSVPPAHHWYEVKHPGGSLFLQYSRQEQTILTRFRNGKLRALTFKDRNKFSPTCIKCSAWGFQNKIFMKTLIMLDFLKMNVIMDKVWLDMEISNNKFQ